MYLPVLDFDDHFGMDVWAHEGPPCWFPVSVSRGAGSACRAGFVRMVPGACDDVFSSCDRLAQCRWRQAGF